MQFPKSSVVRWGNRKGDQGGADHWSCEQLASSTLFLILKTNFDMCLLNIFETWPRSTCRADRQRTSPGPWTSRSPARKVAIMVGKSLQHNTGWTETIIWLDFPNLGFWPSILHRATCNQSFPLETKNNAYYSKLISEAVKEMWNKTGLHSPISCSRQLFIESERVRGTWRRVRPVVLLTLCHSWGAWGEALPIKSHLQSLIYNLW